MNIANIRENFTTFDDISKITASSISDLVDDFRRITLTASKYAMPLTIQKRLKFTIDWILDFERVNRSPTLVRIGQDIFRSALKKAGKRAAIIKKQKDKSDTISREAASGPALLSFQVTRCSFSTDGITLVFLFIDDSGTFVCLFECRTKDILVNSDQCRSSVDSFKV